MRLRCSSLLAALGVLTLGACAQTGGPPSQDAFGRPDPTVAPVTTKAVSRPEPRTVQPYDGTVRAVVRDLQSFWQAEFPVEYVDDYDPLRTFYAYGPKTNMPVCDGQRLPYLLMQGNAFYCPEDDFIAWDDVGLFPRLERVYGRFAIALVLAHEFGHAIQERGGVDEDGIIMEQQADCLAGAWARHLPKGDGGSVLALAEGDLDAAVAGLIGFRDIVGMTGLSEGAHGTGFDRARAFQEGYADGVGRCGDYVEDPPTLVGLPFKDVASMLFGGDAPFSKVVPTAAASLDAYWSPDGPAIRVLRLTGSATATCDVKAVGVKGMPTDDLSYCPTDRVLRWRDDAMRRVYDDIGDFAIVTMLGVIWSEVHDSGDLPATDATLKRALCRTGAWSRLEHRSSETDPLPRSPSEESRQAQSDDTDARWPLSPGDLDEAVQLMLGTGHVLGTTRPGESFARVDSFRIGFTDGPDAC